MKEALLENMVKIGFRNPSSEIISKILEAMEALGLDPSLYDDVYTYIVNYL